MSPAQTPLRRTMVGGCAVARQAASIGWIGRLETGAPTLAMRP